MSCYIVAYIEFQTINGEMHDAKSKRLPALLKLINLPPGSKSLPITIRPVGFGNSHHYRNLRDPSAGASGTSEFHPVTNCLCLINGSTWYADISHRDSLLSIHCNGEGLMLLLCTVLCQQLIWLTEQMNIKARAIYVTNMQCYRIPGTVTSPL